MGNTTTKKLNDHKLDFLKDDKFPAFGPIQIYKLRDMSQKIFKINCLYSPNDP